jgi:transposase
MEHTAHCERCKEETDISYELTRFLRNLKTGNYIQNNQYRRIVKEFDLPDPEKEAREKQQELLQKLFILNDEMEDVEDEELQEKMEMRKERIHERLRSDF